MCNENSAYVMPCITTCVVTSCTHRTVHAGRPPLCKHGTPESTYGHAIHAIQMIFIKELQTRMC